MEQERPYTETEPETAAETVETVPETAETPAETGEPAPKQPRPRRNSRASRFSAASAASFQTPGARSTATAARGASARGRSRCSHC